MYIENNNIKNYISFWLALMFWIISIMIIVGGLTRLTDSGLSITQWQLFSGFLPPLNDLDWNKYFDLYKQIPEFTELSALKDRFTLKIQSNPVSDTHFEQLLCKGLRNDNWKSLNQKPWAELAKFEDFIKVKAYVDQLLQRALNNQPGEVFDDPYFPEEIQILFKRILKTLVREDKLSISDRKIVKLYKLIRTRAFLFRGEAVSREDLSILRYTADRLQDFEAVANKVDTLLSLK